MSKTSKSRRPGRFCRPGSRGGRGRRSATLVALEKYFTISNMSETRRFTIKTTKVGCRLSKKYKRNIKGEQSFRCIFWTVIARDLKFGYVFAYPNVVLVSEFRVRRSPFARSRDVFSGQLCPLNSWFLGSITAALSCPWHPSSLCG